MYFSPGTKVKPLISYAFSKHCANRSLSSLWQFFVVAKKCIVFLRYFVLFRIFLLVAETFFVNTSSAMLNSFQDAPHIPRWMSVCPAVHLCGHLSIATTTTICNWMGPFGTECMLIFPIYGWTFKEFPPPPSPLVFWSAKINRIGNKLWLLF